MVIGTCGNCGGCVSVPEIWFGTNRPTPSCESCGSVPANPFGARITMVPRPSPAAGSRFLPGLADVAASFATPAENDKAEIDNFAALLFDVSQGATPHDAYAKRFGEVVFDAKAEHCSSEEAKPAKDLGERLRKLRISRNLTLREAASRIGNSPGYLSRVEHQGEIPSAEWLSRIARLYELDAAELLSLAVDARIRRAVVAAKRHAVRGAS